MLDNTFSTQILEQLPCLIVVMDCHSHFLFSNRYTANLFGYKATDEIIGLNAHNMRCPAVESASEFMKQDQCVVSSGNTLSILDFHTYADKGQRIFVTKKSPFYDKGQLRGVICQCTEIQNETLMQLCRKLAISDQYYEGKKKFGGSYTFDALINDKLSTRERDCLFYLIRGYTMKQISARLDIGIRTVESYLDNIKSKTGCQKKSDLIDYGIVAGYLKYLPSDLASKNTSLLMG